MNKQYLMTIAAGTVALLFAACGDASTSAADLMAEAGLSSSSEVLVPGENTGISDGNVAISSSSDVIGLSSLGEVIGLSSSSVIIPLSSASNLNSNSSVAVSSQDNSSDDDGDDAISEATDPVLTFSAAGLAVTNGNDCITQGVSSVTISCSGKYYLTGANSNFQVIVNTAAADTGNVGLYLGGLDLTSSDAPIFVQNAHKTVLHLMSGTTNMLTDGNSRSEVSYTVNGVAKTDTTNATLYSKDDLTIKGSGSLTVTGNFNNGIQSANDIKIKNGTLVVTAKNNGVKGKGSVQISGGSLNVTSTEGDGIKSDECTEDVSGNCTGYVDNKGKVVITGGVITVKAADDGISASNFVNVSESDDAVTLNITSGSGTPNTSESSYNSFGGGWNGYGGNTTTTTTDESSLKGIKAGVYVQIDAGTITIASEKDAIHANSIVKIEGGDLSVQGRNGAHADDTVYVDNGNFIITQSYEGIEARVIQLNGGVTYINATDDGWNASDGSEDGCTNCYANMTGGHHYTIARGDGLDANYGMNLTGGVAVVAQTGGGNGIFDIGNGSLNLSGTAVLLGAGTTDMTVCPSATNSFKATGSYSQNTNVAVVDGSNNVVGLVVLPFSASQIQWAYGSGNYSVVTGGTFNGTLVESAFAGSGTISGATTVSGSTCSSSGGGRGGFNW